MENNNKLFVGNIEFSVTEEQLAQFFATSGTVVSAKIITNSATGRSKGFGFVEMSSADEAANAINTLDGQELNGRPIAVKKARPMRDRSFRA